MLNRIFMLYLFRVDLSVIYVMHASYFTILHFESFTFKVTLEQTKKYSAVKRIFSSEMTWRRNKVPGSA